MQPMDDALHLARCALTPPTMQHNKYKIVPTKNPKKVAIVGGGIGGMECALVLKKRGHTPVIYEKSDKLGGMYNYASAMSFKEADKKLLEWYDRELKKAGIEVHFNTEIDPINPLLRQYDEVIICTGAVPKKLPVPGFNKTITFEELLTGDKDHGDKIVFFGGGQSACEAAYELVLQGKHPIIVEFANDLIAQVLDGMEVQLPDAMVENQLDGLIQELRGHLQSQNVELEQYLEASGASMEELRAHAREQAVSAARFELAMTEIARLEGIDVTDAEVEQKYSELSAQYQLSADLLRQQLPPMRLRHDLKLAKAQAVIVDTARRK